MRDNRDPRRIGAWLLSRRALPTGGGFSLHELADDMELAQIPDYDPGESLVSVTKEQYLRDLALEAVQGNEHSARLFHQMAPLDEQDARLADARIEAERTLTHEQATPNGTPGSRQFTERASRTLKQHTVMPVPKESIEDHRTFLPPEPEIVPPFHPDMHPDQKHKYCDSDRAHAPHTWTLAAIDGFVYYCPGISSNSHEHSRCSAQVEGERCLLAHGHVGPHDYEYRMGR